MQLRLPFRIQSWQSLHSLSFPLSQPLASRLPPTSSILVLAARSSVGIAATEARGVAASTFAESIALLVIHRLSYAAVIVIVQIDV